MPQIHAVRGVPAPYRFQQQEITEAVARLSRLDDTERAFLEQVHRNSRVESRHFALPLDSPRRRDLRSSNDAFVEAAVELSREAAEAALTASGFRAADVDILVTATSTGFAVPSLDARIAGPLGLRRDAGRMPLVGLGCAAGAAGVSRIAEHLRAFPGHVALLAVVDLCSLTYQRDDRSPANLVSTGLFADGAAAVVAAGDDRESPAAGPAVLATRSILHPGTLPAMGFGLTGRGLRVVLSPEIPDLVRSNLRADVAGFLSEHRLSIEDIDTWVCHPGGPKVLDAVQSSLTLPADALRHSRESLRRKGNMSAASVLHILEDTMREKPPGGTFGLLLAMGPGFAVELALLRW